MLKKTDYIIVGSGLAGSILALTLLAENKSIVIIDEPKLSTSSKVAAGLWNPIVFKRLTKSWMADELVAELNTFYSKYEKAFNTTFLNPVSILKLFSEQQEIDLWLKKSQDELSQFLDSTIYSAADINQSCETGKYGKVKQSGYLNINVFLQSCHVHFRSLNILKEEAYNHTLLKVKETQIEYEGIVSDNIIFCEGHLVSKNPFFNWIPMKPAKGDVLTIKNTNIKLKAVLNKGAFILPIGEDIYKVGATYNWTDLTDTPSKEGFNELISKLSKVIDTSNQEILEHKAGVRPSVIDRRPVMGKHPKHNNVFIFNGMGTKAVMLTPYFAKHFCNFILENKTLNNEVTCERFYKYLPNE